ncbi:hypothetical protein [Haladaptatus sp. AB643]|uniref:hypothetical protein n=1 Tax=Haladaptatus sp. AB643 TaxID=2934174 RepID=UPI00209BE816|nr:hypothetical protein [Haladaptatus sp. AB643]MCO8244279.1 hypothetical protein [Haladaptatus sp. AB643]
MRLFDATVFETAVAYAAVGSLGSGVVAFGIGRVSVTQTALAPATRARTITQAATARRTGMRGELDSPSSVPVTPVVVQSTRATTAA